MLHKENILTRKWERQTILILPFYAYIRTQTAYKTYCSPLPHSTGQMAGHWGGIRTAQWSSVVCMASYSFAAKVESKSGARQEKKGCICG